MPPLFIQMSENNESKLKEIFLNWFENHNEKEKQNYILLLMNNNVFDLFYPDKEAKQR